MDAAPPHDRAARDDRPDAGLGLGPSGDELLRAVLEGTTDTVYVKDLEGRYLLINAAGARELGSTPDAIVGRTDLEILPPELAQERMANDRATLAAATSRTYEERIPADPEPRVFLSTQWPYRTTAGDVIGLVGISRDISARKHAERRLEHTVSLLRATLEATTDAILVVDATGRITNINQRFATLWRLPKDVLDARDETRALELILAQLHDPDAFLARAREIQEHADAESFDLLHFRDGRVVERFSRPQWSDGRAVGRVWSFRDVTERHRAEDALRDSEARYRDLFENATDAVYLHDLAGDLVALNHAAEAMLGYRRDELLRMNVRQIVAPRSLPHVQDSLVRGAAREPLPQGELDLVTRTGMIVPVEVRGRLVLRAGEAPLIQGVVRDLSTRRRAERAREEQAAIAGALARVGHELLATAGPADLLQRTCALVVELMAADAAYVLLADDEDVFGVAAALGSAPEQLEASRALRIPRRTLRHVLDPLSHDDVTRASIAGRAETPLRRRAVNAGIQMVMHLALRRAGTVIGTVVVCRRRAEAFSAVHEAIGRGMAQTASVALEKAQLVEELARANRVRSEFVATMSHELRTPLHIALGYHDMLLDGSLGPLSPEQEDTVRRLARTSRELFELIEAVLDMSRLEAGRIVIASGACDLGDVLGEIERELRPLAKPGVAWRVPRPEPPIVLDTDAAKLKIALKNLAVNALKFTDRGEVRIAVGRRDDGVAVEVSDSGCGIPPDQLDAIFEPFRQARVASSVPAGGVGLGLHIVSRLVELLQGTITVESVVGRGSHFRLWIPDRIG